MTRTTNGAITRVLFNSMFAALILISYQTDAQITPRYFGYEISASVPNYKINSDIAKISGLNVSYFGIRAGGIFSTSLIKLRASAGLHYGNANLPHSFDLLSASASAQIYPLRIKQVRYHSIEPYVITGVHQYQTKFYGGYLGDGPTGNRSTGEEDLLGRTNSTQLMGGVGLEYQLENESNNFIHFFTEFNYGVPIHEFASKSAFSKTTICSSWVVNFGVSFGIVRE